MIILGDRHQFTDIELATLKEKFISIDHISYKDTQSQVVIEQIESCIQKLPKSVILLNTQAHIPDELLSYLVKLESKGILYISTESFLEQYLEKCYIEEGQTNITFLEKIKPYNLIQHIQKRFVDYSGVFIIGFFMLPFMLYAIYRIQKESPGSVLFRQKRV